MDLETFLVDHGWRVLGPATSVERALELISVEPPALGLLDVNLRGKLVTPVAERLRDIGVPFLLLSAYNMNTFDVEILAHATNVGKPFEPRGLLRAMANALK